MLVACTYGVSTWAADLIRPAPVPSHYVKPDAIARHQEKARHAVGEEAMETPACLQPVGAVIRRRPPDSPEWASGSPAVWLCGVLASVPPGETIWTFHPEWLPRAVTLACIRQGVKPVPEPVLVTSRYRDPFALLFGSGRLDRDACLKSVGLKTYRSSDPAGELNTLTDLVVMIGRE